MVGKNTTHTGRFATIIKAFETAVSIAKSIPGANAKVVTPELEAQCKEAVRKLPADAFIIGIDQVKSGLKLLEVANLTKLALSGYDIHPLESFEYNFNALLAKAASRKANVALNSHGFSNQTIKLMQKVYALPYSITYPGNISKNNLSVDDVSLCFNKLEDINLGQVFTVKSKNGKVVNHFIRIDSKVLENDISIGKALIDIGCNVDDVKERLIATEETEADLLGDEVLNNAICESGDDSENQDNIRNENGKRLRNNEESSETQAKRLRLGESEIILRRNDNGILFKYTDQLIKRLRTKRHAKRNVSIPIAMPIFNPNIVPKTPLAQLLDTENDLNGVENPLRENAKQKLNGNRLDFIEDSPTSSSNDGDHLVSPNADSNNNVVADTSPELEEVDDSTQFAEFANRILAENENRVKVSDSRKHAKNHTSDTISSLAKKKTTQSKSQVSNNRAVKGIDVTSATQGDQPQVKSKPVTRSSKKL
jgi:hypothetical protein